MFKKPPERMIGYIHDYIGEDGSDYLDNYEEISNDFTGVISPETYVLSNLCAIITQMNTPHNLLDVGCGKGILLKESNAKHTKVGMDISSGELLQIEDPHVIKVRAYAEDMPFNNNIFDMVICCNVLEHVLDAGLAAYEINRVLRPGGFLLLACPWKQDLSVYNLSAYKERYKQYKYKHLRSIGWMDISFKWFPDYKLLSWTDIKINEKGMEFTTYPIRFMVWKKL